MKNRTRPHDDREAGFTLIELLVVVIIIGILAAIAIPIYLGITNGAKESATKSDLINGKTAIAGYAVDNNGFIPASSPSNDVRGSVVANPTTGAAAVDLLKYGWSKSANTTALAYSSSTPNTTTGAWCLQGTSATGAVYSISSNKALAKSSCSATASDW